MLGLQPRRPVAAAEAVVDSRKSAIGRTRNLRVELAHPARKTRVADLQDNVVVVVHYRPGKDPPLVPSRDAPQRCQEESSEHVVEDGLLVVSSRDNVVVGSRLLDTLRTRHNVRRYGRRASGPGVVIILFQFRPTFVSLAWHRDTATAAKAPRDA